MTSEETVLYSDIGEELDYPSLSFETDPFKKDVYGNEYFESEDLIEVKPSGNSFEEKARNCLLYAHNFYTLENTPEIVEGSVSVPDFEVGVSQTENSPEPYFVMENVDGMPLTEIDGHETIYLDKETEDENLAKLEDEFEQFNEVGWFLGTREFIGYSEPRENDDMIVDSDYSITYINPGADTEKDRTHKAISNGEWITEEEFEEWTSEEFWNSAKAAQESVQRNHLSTRS